jgi:two-component system LytT family response regulator
MNITAVLVDDERPNLQNLAALLKTYCPQVSVIGMATETTEAAQLIRELQPDIVFLDIQMPGETGFDLLRGLDKQDFEVIFVTAFDQFAIQAMRFAAVDYLLKPVDINELQLAVSRAVGQLNLKQGSQQIRNLLQLLKNQNNREDQRIALSTMKETRFVNPEHIVRCESSNNYTTFYITGGEELLVSKPIYEFDDLLRGHGFIRCHQSHLVNKRYVKSWKKEYGDFLSLSEGPDVPISRGKKEGLKLALGG